MKTGRKTFLVSLFVLTGLSLMVIPVSAAIFEQLARPQTGRSMRASSAHRINAEGKFDPNGRPDPNSNWDNKNVAPGATALLLDARGPGAISHIWITFLDPQPQDWAPKGSANHQEILIRMYWDGSPKPAVESPLGDFFASGFGKRMEIISLPVVVEDADSYNCFWSMPFRKSARIEIVNQSDKPISLLYYNIDWIKKDIPADAPYFYARYRQEYPVEKGSDYTLLETRGKGHYVGTVLSVHTRSPMWFGEGDEKIYIDGEKDASIWGTGTEDYFLSAWGLKRCSTPYAGVGYFDQWGIVGGHTSAYRWHVADPIVFNTGIKVTFEHYGWISADENPQHKTDSWNEREDDYSSVAFWYQTGEPTFDAVVPGAEDRKLPNLDQITDARLFNDPNFYGNGKMTIADSQEYPYNYTLYVPQDPQRAWIQIPFEVRKKAPVVLLLKMIRGTDFGKYQAYLNGVKIGDEIDLYLDRSDLPAMWEYHLLNFWPQAGQYQLKLECIGKNSRSEGYKLGIDSVRLRERRPRVEKYGFDKDKDWRKEPVLYR